MLHLITLKSIHEQSGSSLVETFEAVSPERCIIEQIIDPKIIPQECASQIYQSIDLRSTLAGSYFAVDSGDVASIGSLGHSGSLELQIEKEAVVVYQDLICIYQSSYSA